MAGFVVRSMAVVDGELHLDLETTATVVACCECGVRAVGNGRRWVRVRDLPISGRPTVLCWAKRLWRCADPDCEARCWTETSERVEPSGALSVRAGAEICRAVGEDSEPVSRVAARFGIGWHAAMTRVRTYGTPLVNDPARAAGCRALGVDETTFSHAGPAKRTGVRDGRGRHRPGAAGRPGRGPICQRVGRLARRAGKGVAGRLAVASIDAFRGYANALTEHLPDATLVIDHFHAIKLANVAVDRVRRRTQHDTLGHRGRAGDPLYRVRRLLLIRPDRLTATGWAKLIQGVEAGDPAGHLGAAWVALQHLRAVYAAGEHASARRALQVFYTWVADHDQVPELVTLATTISAWQEEVLAYHRTDHASNGPTEAVNLLIEKVRRIGHGFRNFANYRLRLLLTCGLRWNTPPVARLRGRKPRLSA